jgi:hypothetical protein
MTSPKQFALDATNNHPISLSKAMPITCLTHQQYAIALVLSLQNNQERLIKEI